VSAPPNPLDPRSLGDRLRRIEARHWLAILNSLILIVAQYFYSILESYDVLLIAITRRS